MNFCGTPYAKSRIGRHTFSGLTITIPTPAGPWTWPVVGRAVPLKYNQYGNFGDPAQNTMHECDISFLK